MIRSPCTEAPFNKVKPLVVAMEESSCLASKHVKGSAGKSGSATQESFVEVAVNMQKYISIIREGVKLLPGLFLRTDSCERLARAENVWIQISFSHIFLISHGC